MKNFLILGLTVVAATGCGPKTPTEPPYEADAKSGPDGKRVGARSMRPNAPMADEVSYQKQDQTDWYMVRLDGKPGVLTTELTWSNGDSDVMVDVFDEQGAQIAASAPRTPGAKSKTLLSKIEHMGTYFLRVTAPGKTDGSPYTLTAKWEEPVAVVTPPPPPPPEPEPAAQPDKKGKKKKAEPEFTPKMETAEKEGATVQGRIVSAYREGEGLTLQIDKGSGAGIKPGMKGTILSGPSGEEPLDGGDFEITQVVDSHRCLAKSSLKSTGKHTRVVITLSR